VTVSPEVHELGAVGAQRTARWRALIGEHYAPIQRDLEGTPERQAWVLAMLIGCAPGCVHLEAQDPARVTEHPDLWPLFVILRLRRVVCYGCAPQLATAPPPPVRVPDDCCDVCEESTAHFRQFSITQPWLILSGDACERCDAALGLSGRPGPLDG
jgi:hypothetical protein